MAFLGGALLGGKAAGGLGAVGCTGVGAPVALGVGLGLTLYGAYKMLTPNVHNYRYVSDSNWDDELFIHSDRYVSDSNWDDELFIHSDRYVSNSNGGSRQPRKTYRERQEDGDMDSSEVANTLNLGATDTYANIKRFFRDFSKGEDGDKGYVEADHIPPLESLRRARDQPEFRLLRHINPNLYNMVQSLTDDPRGENLLTVQVARHHHRDALSTGRSRASTEARLLLARRIARGEVEKMLKQAFIIAHPYASQQIRDDAGLGNRSRPWNMLLSEDRTMRIYTAAFLSLLEKYYKMGIIDSQELSRLIQYVKNYGYLDRDSDLYKEILDIVKLYGKPQN